METKTLNIYQKLLHISNEIKPILKDMEVGSGYNSYKAVSEAQVKDVVKPIEFKYGVYSYPMKIDIVHQETIVTKKEYKGTIEEKTKFIVRAKILYRFVNTDKPEEFVDQETFGDGVDPLDKSAGKAMTYAIKYGLINAYKMISGEDPDQFSSSDNEIKQTNHKTDYTNNEEMLQQGIEKGREMLESLCNKAGEDAGVIKAKFLNNHKWSSIKDITFKDNAEFKQLMAEVKNLVQINKDEKEVGF